MSNTLNNILEKQEFQKEDIMQLLALENPTEIEQLRQQSYLTMKENCGEKVYLRGLIEFSNYCINDCLYCGIRKSNNLLIRYTLTEEEIIKSAIGCERAGYGSLVLQSGERRDDKFIEFVESLVKKIKNETKTDKNPNGLGITLSIGEQTRETYRTLFEAGTHRYLLRIETSSPELFRKIHPPEISYKHRLECLLNLKEIGFQVGTGVMIGIPGQTIEHLADDILFFKKMDVDMIGMGPYIVHSDTPMNIFNDYYIQNKKIILGLALKMIAVTRQVLKDVNIASTTALQAMSPFGREEGLSYGANVIMPQLTPERFRKEYKLYDGKPCTDENSKECFACIEQRIGTTGRTIGYNEWGDSKHFNKRNGNR